MYILMPTWKLKLDEETLRLIFVSVTITKQSSLPYPSLAPLLSNALGCWRPLAFSPTMQDCWSRTVLDETLWRSTFRGLVAQKGRSLQQREMR